MSAPSETPKEMLSVLNDLLEDGLNPEEMRNEIIKKLMGGITQDDARRIVYGQSTKGQSQ